MAISENEKNNVAVILGQAIPNGESMLSELLGQPVTISVDNINSADASSLGSIFPGSYLVAPVEISDDGGNVVLLVSQDQAAVMADLMIGQDGSNPPAALEDLHLSAVTELCGQVVDAVVGNISSQVAKSFMTIPSEISVIDIGTGVVPGIDGEVVVMEGNITIGNLGTGKIGFVFSGEVAKLMKEGQKEAASASGFVSDLGSGSKQNKKATAQNVNAPELAEERPAGSVYDSSLDIVLDVPLNVTVELGRTQKLVREVLDMAPGSVIELDKLAGEPVDILVNGKYIAKGEVVVIDENFGIRITDIIRPADRLPKI